MAAPVLFALLFLAGCGCAAPVGWLNRELAPVANDKTYLFVVGAHHSGTTLTDLILCQHDQISCLKGTHKPMDEGQHLQHVYPPARKLGSHAEYSFAFHPNAYMTEDHELMTEASRQALLKAWQPYWNLSAPVLLEKSPRHATMTRFLEAIFNSRRSAFIASMRHPLACAHKEWGWYFRHNHINSRPVIDTCGEVYIRHWLQLYGLLFADVPHLRKFTVLQYETYLGQGASSRPLSLSERKRVAQSFTDGMLEFLGLDPSVTLEFTAQSGEAESDAGPTSGSSPSPTPASATADHSKSQDAGSSATSYDTQYEVDDDDDAGDDDDGLLASAAPAGKVSSTPRGGSTTTHIYSTGPRQRRVARSLSEAHVEPAPTITFAESTEAGTHNGTGARAERSPTGRRLLEYHGSRKHVQMDLSDTGYWIDEWFSRVNMMSASCRSVIQRYESELNQYGYSLVDLRRINVGPKIKPYYLQPDEHGQHLLEL